MAVRPIDKTKPSNQRCWNCKHFRDARVIEEGPYIESRKFYCETSSNVVRYWSCCSYFEWDPDKQYEHPTLTPPNEWVTLETVAEILAEQFCDECACNVNGNDEWLPMMCHYGDVCPDPPEHLGCWMELLRNKYRRPPERQGDA